MLIMTLAWMMSDRRSGKEEQSRTTCLEIVNPPVSTHIVRVCAFSIVFTRLTQQETTGVLSTLILDAGGAK